MTTQKEWDIYFMKVAKLSSEMSKCLSRKIGACLVRDNHIIACGYNGPASGVTHCDYRLDDGSYSFVTYPISDTCPRKRMGYGSGDGMEHCPAVHAEVNTICFAARNGIATDGATIYCWCNTPCTDCAKELINAGIKRIVCLGMTESRPWASIKSEDMFRETGVSMNVITKEEVER